MGGCSLDKQKFRVAKQIVVCGVLFGILFGVALWASKLANDNAIKYFDKEAVYNNWANFNTILYCAIALVIFGVSLPFMIYCRRGTKYWDGRKKQFPMMVFWAVVTAAFLAALGSLVCNYINIVTTGDFMVIFHLLFLLLIPLALLLVLLMLFVIKPIANLIRF